MAAEPDPAARRLQVDIIEEAGDWSAVSPLVAAIEGAAAAVASEATLDLDHTAVAIALADDATVRVLNRTYRQKDTPTNVLSFPAHDGASLPPPARVFLGDIVLAAETVAREASDLGIPRVHHLQHLVVHGLLHLIGFDHETDADAAEMETLETAILARIGVPDPYLDPPAGGPPS